MLKYQQFKDNENEKIKSIILKCQQFDIYNDKKEQDLDKFENKDENKRYIMFFFIILLFLF